MPKAGRIDQWSDRPSVAGWDSWIECGGIGGIFTAAPGTYQTYRQISAHPTNALVRGIVAAPIVANSWRWKKCRADVAEEWVQFAQQVLGPLRQSLVRNALGRWNLGGRDLKRFGRFVAAGESLRGSSRCSGTARIFCWTIMATRRGC